MPIDFNVQVNDLTLGTIVSMFAIDAQFAVSGFPARFSYAGPKTPLGASQVTAAAAILESGTTSSVGWSNFGLVTMVPGQMIVRPASSFVAKLQFTAGSPIINACAIKRTLTRSLAVVSTTPVSFNNVAPYPITLQSPGTVTTDPIALSLDNDHDYWFAITTANNAQNNNTGFAQDGAGGRSLSTFTAATDYTTATTMPSVGSATLLLLGFY